MTALFQESLLVILVLSGLPLLACALTGLIISFLQAATQIQEQTITYLVKLITLVVLICVASPAAVELLDDYSEKIFVGIGEIGR